MKLAKPVQFKWLFPSTVVGLAWIMCIGVLDWLTGPELSLSAFYLPGVALVAWFSGIKPAVAMAVCAALAWLLAELVFNLNYSTPLIPYWNGTIRLSFFLITAFLTSEVRTRQRTEALLREHDNILNSILDSMGDSVVVVSGDGMILAFNPAAEKLFGCNPIGQDAGRWLSKVETLQLDGFTPDTGKSSLLRLAISRELSRSHEFSLRKPGEEETKVLELTALPLLGKQREPSGAVLVIADLTSRRTMEKQIAEASEREQRRIGQDLHDGVCQHLVGVAFAAGSLQSALESRSLVPEAAAAGEIATLINDAITEARNLAHGLYPSGLEEGIEVALRTLASTTQEQTGITCTVQFDKASPPLDPVRSTHLYRIAQESISNACRHGSPDTIEISFQFQSPRLRLAITDNGKGMDNAQTNHSGIGLSLMKYRANLIEGTLEIDSSPGQGTRIVCSLSPALTMEEPV